LQQVPTNNLNHCDWFPSSFVLWSGKLLLAVQVFSSAGRCATNFLDRGAAWQCRYVTSHARIDRRGAGEAEDVLEYLGAVENERLAARGASDLQADRRLANRPCRYWRGKACDEAVT
jgi:hypothetical protein